MNVGRGGGQISPYMVSQAIPVQACRPSIRGGGGGEKGADLGIPGGKGGVH
jgi:hypothetical protein